MLKVERAANGNVILTVCGRLQADNVSERSEVLAAEPPGRPVVLDLKDASNSDRSFQMMLIRMLAGVGAAATVLATTALAQSAKDIRGPTPYVEIQNEPAPKLIVDPPIPGGLAIGLLWAQYRVENVRIQQVFGAGALKVSPRVGHLHIQVDDAPFLWADASDNNTVDVAFFTPGQHKVKIDLVDATHNVFPGQSVTLKFTILKGVGEAAHAEQHAPTK